LGQELVQKVEGKGAVGGPQTGDEMIIEGADVASVSIVMVGIRWRQL
jgi:hypothetical protein